jgi:hypothetical protein
MFKRKMQRSFEGKRYSHKEVCMLLQEASQIVNSRSILVRYSAEGEPLCPADFLISRASSAQVLLMKFETGKQLVRWLKMIQEAKEELWGRWVRKVFLFHYHEDGSKKLNACNQFFLCMVYF